SHNNIIVGLDKVIENTSILGRWQTVSQEPLIICDIAHNVAAFQAWIYELSLYQLKKHIILGFSKDKDIKSIISLLPNNYHYYICGSSNKRIINPNQLTSIFEDYNLYYKTFDLSCDAYNYLLNNCNKNDLILITGSTFIVSDILKYLDKV
ncbi:MAG: bifunctional folylpolyglutamate synthase/dihydrofolate synthase, partial [Bacteroidota bacterium]|nr:bifunctional folylpolyglutamate synthase/dihydrofolate synthase [Bacteroidota bacterium]